MRWTLCPDARGERPAAPRGAPARRAACAVRTPSPQKSKVVTLFRSQVIKFQGFSVKKLKMYMSIVCSMFYELKFS